MKIKLEWVKSFIFLLLLSHISSCKESASGERLNSRYEVDTLLIEAGADIIYLEDNFILSGLSENKSILFNFDSKRLRLEKIDINQHKLVEVVELEKEGPNGIGDWHIGFKVWNDSTFILQGSNVFYFVDDKGTLTNKVSIEHLLFMEESLLGKDMYNGFELIDSNFWFIIGSIKTPDIKLMKYNFLTDDFKLFDIPESDLRLNDALITKVDKFTFYYYPPMGIMQYPDGVILNNRVYSQLVTYGADELDYKTHYSKSDFFNDIPKVEKIKEVSNEIQAGELKREMEKNMHFRGIYWDDKKQQYYRLGYMLTSGINIDEDAKYDNYIFIYDTSFNLVEEFEVPEVKIMPKKVFIIDGSLYIFNNFYDELGFIKVKII
jgi:hypothetical protein